MHIDRWDDLRFVLAAAREGSLTAAARALNVDQSTVTRRLTALQDELGRRLFERLRGGIQWTPAGEAVAKAAEDLESRVFGLERDLTGDLPDVAGPVRLTAPELLVVPWMARFVELVKDNPGLELDLIGGDDFRNLTRREADVALRFTAKPPEHLVGRRLAKLAGCVYAAPSLADQDVLTMPWVGWDLSDAPVSTTDRVRKRLGANGPYVMRVNSYGLWVEAGLKGAGALTLPCIYGDAQPGLERRSDPWMLDGDLWVLTHPDLRRSPRVRRVMDVLSAFAASQRDALAGKLCDT